MQGKIIKGIAGFYYVYGADEMLYECKAKGIFRKDNQKPLVGDNVEITVLDEQEHTGNLIRILPRKNSLIRPAVANGEVWKCTQTLNTPTGYQGGAIRLELIQEVNGEMTSTQVVDGEKLTFPYTLDITGAPGVSAGTLYVSEQINGTYQQLGQYPISFQKAE